MRVVKSAATMQRLGRWWRRRGVRVGLVPTMGYLHEGHLSLVRRARRAVGRRGVVVVSLYVNPTQFAPHEDLARYPRDPAGDRRACRESGADVLFMPGDAEMYARNPEGAASTFVVEEALSTSMEGASRPTHFRGVTTVVAKLCNLVLPDVAVFGAKDFQQAAVVRRMVRDLKFPIRILVAPTVREPDGLAMSSRNRYLSPAERPQARVLWQCLRWADRRLRSARQPLPAAELRSGVVALVSAQPAARLDYVAFFDPETLEPLDPVPRGARMALAIVVGSTRLIDNAPVG
ncbi:MAG TPA: pantoate--beta-alanine ligase [Verrucomicrobiota bacterium]|nr:pantoate--beta-alanine ligase [Verrucomicrobiota bacterium]HNU53388.1 pantoate--beta-alanine ligase [Verrucomicrobiota bacterium]